MRKLATIEKILEKKAIIGADKIEAVRVRDWWVVSKKDDFSVGDLCVYFEIDSFLPLKPEYDFLLRGSSPKKMLLDGEEKQGIRLKTIKLRGQISQGLVLPLTENLPKEVGTDVTEILGVFKYEMPIPVSMSGEVKGSFPSFLPKTDEERIQNCSELLNIFKGEKFYITSKIDGTSGTFFKYNGEFGCCSRNLELKKGSTVYWQIAEKFDLENKLPDYFCIQGEVYGQGIQKNPLKINGQKLAVFNVYDIKQAKYLDYPNFVNFVKELGLETVPIIDEGLVLNHSVDDLLELANKKSPINQNELQEGIVLRPVIEKQASIGGVLTRLSFKAISNEYLLKNEE